MRVSLFVPTAAVLGAAAVLVAVAVEPARAQTAALTDSLPARAGSWALEGGLGSGSATLSALRFVTPRAALGVAVSALDNHQTRESTGPDGSGGTERNTYTTFSLDLGYRRYARPREALAPFVTLGPTLSYSHNTNSVGRTAGRFESRTTQLGAGAFGELGGAYLPVRRVSVNASAQLRVARLLGSDRATSLGSPARAASTTGRTRGWTADLGFARLSATLFF